MNVCVIIHVAYVCTGVHVCNGALMHVMVISEAWVSFLSSYPSCFCSCSLIAFDSSSLRISYNVSWLYWPPPPLFTYLYPLLSAQLCVLFSPQINASGVEIASLTGMWCLKIRLGHVTCEPKGLPVSTSVSLSFQAHISCLGFMGLLRLKFRFLCSHSKHFMDRSYIFNPIIFMVNLVITNSNNKL